MANLFHNLSTTFEYQYPKVASGCWESSWVRFAPLAEVRLILRFERPPDQEAEIAFLGFSVPVSGRPAREKLCHLKGKTSRGAARLGEARPHTLFVGPVYVNREMGHDSFRRFFASA